MNILQKTVHSAQPQKQSYRSPQIQQEKYDYLVEYYHVKNQEKALCNQHRRIIYLCSREDFEVLPPDKKCTRCQWLLGHREDYHRTA